MKTDLEIKAHLDALRKTAKTPLDRLKVDNAERQLNELRSIRSDIAMIEKQFGKPSSQ